MSKRKRSPIICRCNNITLDTIQQAFVDGCDTLDKLFDATTAGVGPCGGSCRKITGPILEYYLKHKTFSVASVPPAPPKRPKK
ncbi:MAG: NAD(P)H-nitrite reductase [Bdellovibrio sp. 28-41-41]|nr:MAG: NAD(P)H-nitrite reductase [Bdellovibrio sp. 28-41-41]